MKRCFKFLAVFGLSMALLTTPLVELRGSSNEFDEPSLVMKCAGFLVLAGLLTTVVASGTASTAMIEQQRGLFESESDVRERVERNHRQNRPYAIGGLVVAGLGLGLAVWEVSRSNGGKKRSLSISGIPEGSRVSYEGREFPVVGGSVHVENLIDSQAELIFFKITFPNGIEGTISLPNDAELEHITYRVSSQVLNGVERLAQGQ